jgi:hypothetical protein
MGVSATIDNRDPEAKLGQGVRKLVDKHVLASRIREAGDHFPLVDAVVGDHQHVSSLRSKKCGVVLSRIDG